MQKLIQHVQRGDVLEDYYREADLKVPFLGFVAKGEHASVYANTAKRGCKESIFYYVS